MTTATNQLANMPAAPVNPVARRADDFDDYPRDQWQRPRISVLDAAGRPVAPPPGYDLPFLAEPYVRASRAGSVLEYEGALNSYHLRNAVIGFCAREDLFARAMAVEEPGAAGRSEMDKLIKEAQAAAGADVAANLGTACHAFAEKHDRGEPIPALPDKFRAWLDAYRQLTAGWTWHAIEARLVCRQLKMAGKTDRIGSPPGWMVAPDGTVIGPGDRVVVDVKTASSSRYFGVKFAVQFAVYAYGEFYDLETGLSVPTGARQDWGLVVHLPSGATSGALYWVDLRKGLAYAHEARRVLAAQADRSLVVAAGELYGHEDNARRVASAIVGPEAAGFLPGQPAPIAQEPAGKPRPSDGMPPIRENLGSHLQAAAGQDQRSRVLRAVNEATSVAQLEQIGYRHVGTGDWTDEHTAAAVARRLVCTVLDKIRRAPSMDQLAGVYAQYATLWTAEMNDAAGVRRREIERAAGADG